MVLWTHRATMISKRKQHHQQQQQPHQAKGIRKCFIGSNPTELWETVAMTITTTAPMPKDLKRHTNTHFSLAWSSALYVQFHSRHNQPFIQSPLFLRCFVLRECVIKRQIYWERERDEENNKRKRTKIYTTNAKHKKKTHTSQNDEDDEQRRKQKRLEWTR